MEAQVIGGLSRPSKVSETSKAARVLRVFAVIVVLTFSGCELEPKKQLEGTIVVEDTVPSNLGTCQVVLSVKNTGETEINGVDIVFSITTDSRRYYRRIVEGGSIPPGKTAGLVQEITFDSPDETVDTDATAIEWRCFS